MKSLGKIKQFWQRFKRAQKGTTAVIFGIVALPLLAFAGGAVDYGRAVKTKAQLITTLDAAVLAAMMQYSLDDQTDYKQVIKNYVLKNLEEADKSYHGIEIDVNVPDITEEGEMTAGISTTVKTNFLMLVGFDQFDIHINSASMVGGNKLDVVMVLDNTRSMRSDDKIGSLRTSGVDLVETLLPNGDDENVRISLVPFADLVRLKMEDRGEPGLDIPARYDVPVSGWCDTRETIRENCDSRPRPDRPCVIDGVPSMCSGGTEYYNCDVVPNPNYGNCNDDRVKTYDWKGCMAARPHPLNVQDQDYGTGVPGLMMTWQHCNNITPVERLTSSKATITAAIEGMQADRTGTNIPVGLAWGWRALSNIAPFTDGSPDDDNAIKRVIVLMTDGSNTVKPRKRNATDNDIKNHDGEVWDHPTTTNAATSAANALVSNGLTEELCTNIKAKEIMVFTIAFDVTEGSDIEALMQGCAGNGGKYFDADDAVALGEAFKEIGLSLLNLRLSQ